MKTRSGDLRDGLRYNARNEPNTFYLRTDRPTIFLKNDILTSHINHRLNADAHTAAQ